MTLSDIQSVASRCQYLLKVTLDPKYTPYNNWHTVAGDSAATLADQITYWKTWPRVAFVIEQPVGFFMICYLNDIQSILYLMYQEFGWCKPNIWDSSMNMSVNPPVVCVPPNTTLRADTAPIQTPSATQVNYPSFLLATEAGQPLLADNYFPLPSLRDWTALGLGPKPGFLGN